MSSSAKFESSMNKESSSELPVSDNNNQYNKCINSSNINNNKKGSSEPNESSVKVKGPRLRQTRLRELNPETRDLCIHENIEPTDDPSYNVPQKTGSFVLPATRPQYPRDAQIRRRNDSR